MSIADLNEKIITLETNVKALEQQLILLLHRNDLLLKAIGTRDLKIIDLEMESVETLIKKNELDI
jgi:hypothetical protein